MPDQDQDQDQDSSCYSRINRKPCYSQPSGINKILIIKSMHLLSSAVTHNTHKFFRTVLNVPIFKYIFHVGDSRFKRNYTKAKSVENSDQNSSTVKDETDFTDKLIKWAIQNNISYLAFSKLLKVLSEHGIEGLPKSSRALLKAKEEEIKVSPVPPGIYTHFGLGKNLRNLISTLMDKDLFSETDVEVSIFIDNLPLSEFTQLGLWVILGSVAGFPNNIFFVGAYHGYTRPKNSNLFLSEFVAEAKQLCAEGLEINGVTYNVKIKRLICDAPAKAFVLNIKDFNGYSSCTKCNIVGEFKGRTISFLEKSTPKTDEDFEKNELYQTHKTNLLDIPYFGVVSNVTLDYMHLVCLGVVRKILSIWVTSEKHWISENSASEMIKTLASFYPCEFQIKPKSFKIFTRWSGPEFRQFLLYYGPVVLMDNLKKEYLDHFLLLHAACRLLCIEPSPENVDRGRTLLDSFVETYKKLYKNEQITHNFHGLYHLADECASHGTLDAFSAFPFEKFLLKVRNSIKRSKKVKVPHTILREAYEGVFTKSLAKLAKQPYKVGKKLKTDDSSQFSQYESLSMKNFDIIPGTKGDKYVLLKNNKIIEVLSVLGKKEKSNQTHLIAGKEFSSVSNFHSEPFERLKLNMYKVGDVSGETEMWPVDMIDKKCMVLPTGKKETVIISLLEENF